MSDKLNSRLKNVSFNTARLIRHRATRIEVIEECETQEQANERERFWIKVLNCKIPTGYNRSNGGESGIHKPRTSPVNKEVFVMTIGDNIKSLRLGHNLSQAELVNVAGVSDKAVSSWKQNKSVPRMGSIQKNG